jgi:hypothetical protein
MIPRKPASVFPDPVGEERRTDCFAAISGMQSSCASVGLPKVLRNHWATVGCRVLSKVGSIFAVTTVPGGQQMKSLEKEGNPLAIRNPFPKSILHERWPEEMENREGS